MTLWQRIKAWFTPAPIIYPPWDVRAGPEAFTAWMTRGPDKPKDLS